MSDSPSVCLTVIVMGMVMGYEARSDEPSDLARHRETAKRITLAGLRSGHAYPLLSDLCATAPHRLAGSEGAARAVEWGRRALEKAGLDRVRLEPVTVPHWVRGPVESAAMIRENHGSTERVPLQVCALGGSVATPESGITAEVLAVQSFEELHAAGDKAKGKIIFFNRAFDRGLFRPFEAYGRAVGQRAHREPSRRRGQGGWPPWFDQ